MENKELAVVVAKARARVRLTREERAVLLAAMARGVVVGQLCAAARALASMA